MHTLARTPLRFQADPHPTLLTAPCSEFVDFCREHEDRFRGPGGAVAAPPELLTLTIPMDPAVRGQTLCRAWPDPVSCEARSRGAWPSSVSCVARLCVVRGQIPRCVARLCVVRGQTLCRAWPDPAVRGQALCRAWPDPVLCVARPCVVRGQIPRCVARVCVVRGQALCRVRHHVMFEIRDAVPSFGAAGSRLGHSRATCSRRAASEQRNACRRACGRPHFACEQGSIPYCGPEDVGIRKPHTSQRRHACRVLF